MGNQTLDQAAADTPALQPGRREKNRLLGECDASRLEQAAREVAPPEMRRRRRRMLRKTAGVFVDHASHDFRTPLTVIKDYVGLVRDGVAGAVSDEQCRMLDIAAARVDDLNTMVDNMLAVCKLEAGLLRAWRRNCSLADVIGQVQPALDRLAAVQGATLEVDCPADLPAVYCDAEQVGRVINNLVLSALKYGGGPDLVRMSVAAQPDQSNVVVGVSNNGKAIDGKTLLPILRRFKHRRRRANGFSKKGLGFSLGIAHELVDANLGEMSAVSEPGQGSTFWFTVPMAQPPAVIRRYLNWLARNSRGEPLVSLVHAGISGKVHAVDANAMDCFFNFILRRRDLLFRPGPQQWLLVLPASESQLPRAVARMEAEFAKVNRSRPCGPLPRFELTVAGSWPALQRRQALLERFDAFFDG